MKKALSIILAVMLISIMTGCSTTAVSSATSMAPSSEAASSTASKPDDHIDLKPKTIQVWLLGPGKQKNANAVWDEFNQKLSATLPNTTVEFNVYTGNEYKDKFNNALAAEEPVDLAWVGYATDLTKDQQDGNLMKLDDLIEKYGKDIISILGQNTLDIHRYSDGQLYYVISWQSLFGGRTGIGTKRFLANAVSPTWINDVQKATDTLCSNPTPENMQAVYDLYAEFGQSAMDNNTLYGGFKPKAFTYDPIFQYGSREIRNAGVGVLYGDDTFTVKSLYNTDWYRLYAKNMAEYYKKGYYASDIASKTFSSGSELDPNYPILDCHNAFLYQDDGTSDYMRIVIHDQGIVSLGNATAMAIPYCADEPERAMMFLNEMYANKDLYQLLIYGRKGIDYTDNGDGTITTEYGAQGNPDSPYGLFKWTIGTCMNSLVTQKDTKGYYEQLKAKEEKAYVSPLLGFSFNSAEVEGIVTSLTALDKEYGSMIQAGYTGDKWEATLNEWIAKREAAGEAEVIAEYQKQLNEYIKKNNITTWNYNNQ